MKLIIHRGTHEIGGSCIEIATDSSRIIIDAGLPLEPPTGLPIDLKPRYPRVPGLFGAGPSIDALLLSHAHGDHSGLIADSRPEIPVWLSQGTSKMLMAGALFARQPEVPRERQNICHPGRTFRIGDIRVTPFNVDHSTFDALAFLVEAGGKRLLYSGDLRLHGRKPGMACELVRRISAQPLDALVMEGTHLGSGRPACGLSERDMEIEAARRTTTTPGIALAMFSPLNLDRLVTYFRVAIRARRTLVLDPYAAFVLHLVRGQTKVPDPFSHENIRILVPRGFWNSRAGRCLATKHRANMERRHVDPAELVSAPHRWLMLFRPRMLDAVFNGALPNESLCLYSYWTGYLAKPELTALRERIEKAGSRFITLHASGHIYAADLQRLIREFSPRMLVPIHTASPTSFKDLWPKVRLTEDGENCSI